MICGTGLPKDLTTNAADDESLPRVLAASGRVIERSAIVGVISVVDTGTCTKTFVAALLSILEDALQPGTSTGGRERALRGLRGRREAAQAELAQLRVVDRRGGAGQGV